MTGLCYARRPIRTQYPIAIRLNQWLVSADISPAEITSLIRTVHLHIATTIVSLEVLARDFSGWGERFPAAKREAEEILGRLPQLRRAWLMDLYFFPPLGVRRELADTLAFYPTETHT